MILIRNIRLLPGEKETKLKRTAARRLGIRDEDVRELRILKKSLDARKKGDIHWLYTVCVQTDKEEAVLKEKSGADIGLWKEEEYNISHVESAVRPVVVGFGPAGIFAGLLLAESGLRPLILERGPSAAERKRRVELFWQTGQLDTQGNVQFGEGGAGLFSDGKLNTGIRDRRVAWVMEQLCRYGAPENIRYDAKPHVGTDVLMDVVGNIRRRIEELGGEVRFLSKMVDIKADDDRVKAVVAECDGKNIEIPCTELILAPGHSARDSFEKLAAMGAAMERKPFSMGVRIEHLQQSVGYSQYGASYRKLPPADYKLSCRLPGGGSAYTFCMCPGGYVVAAASEEGGVVTNGMSYSGRSGDNANSALLVTLMPDDFPGEGVLAGMYWQREIERRAFEYGGGGYRAPAQRLGDFLAGRESSGPGRVLPTYRPGVRWGDLRQVLPEKICSTIAEAALVLGKRLSCFMDPDAVLTAPETRSSSPVRILRGGDLQSLSMKGLYPCGEGAGYAGGITSAAVDGLRCAEAVIAAVSGKAAEG